MIRSARLLATAGRHGLALSALLAGVAAHAEPPATRWRCHMIDGSARVVREDLSRLFPGAADHCDALSTPAAVAFDDEEDATPAPAPPAVVWIVAPRAPAAYPALAEVAAAGASLRPLIGEASRRQGLDERLVAALITVESGFHPAARSPKGALGLMQIMPATAARYGVSVAETLLDPRVNLEVGTRYLRDLTQRFPGRTDLVLAAYNAGEGAVMRCGFCVPGYRETQDYVRRISALTTGH